MSRLPANTVTAVDPVAALQRVSDDAAKASARLLPGTRLLMHVLEPLAEGGVRAQIVGGGGEQRLPFDARPGSTLEVLYVGAEPRPTFMLLRGNGQSVDTSISAVARLLAALADTPDPAAPAAGARPLSPPVPAGAGLDVPALGRALEQALARSGLFYEAHQAQWVAGLRTRDQLLEEPQARMALRELPAAPDDTRGAEPAAARAPTAGAAGRSELDGIVHRETVPLVQQQLAALDSGTVVWRGEAWRGQPMEWEVAREGREDETDTTAPLRWNTRIRLALPRLGTIDVAMAMDGQRLDVRMAAADPAAADTLRHGAAELAAALAQAGLSVRRMEVAREEA